MPATPPARCQAAWATTRQPREDVGRSPWRFGPVRQLPADARADLRAVIDSGEASMGCLIEIRPDGVRVPLAGTVLPVQSRKIALHWEEILDLTETVGA